MVLFFSKKENVIVKWIRVCSILVAFTCVFLAIIMDVQYPIWILPLIHAVGIFLLSDRNATISAPGIVTLNVVMFCRYDVVPLAIYMSQSLSRFAINDYYFHQAVWLMAFEQICILLTLWVTGKRRGKGISRVRVESISQLFIPQNKKFIFVLVLLVLLAIVLRFPSLVSGIGLIISGSVDTETREVGFSGIIDMIWRAGLAWIYLYILSIIKDRDSAGKRGWLAIVITTWAYILFTIILNLEISRWYSTVCFVAAMFMVGKIAPKLQKKICIWTILPVLATFAVLSVYKNTSFLKTNSSSLVDFIAELFDVSTLDVYFAGPGCVNNGLNLYKTGNGNLFSLLLDSLRNMPVINHYVDDSYSTVELYASMLGRGDMIVPLAIQSMIYFGAPLFGLLSVMAVVVVRKLDDLYARANNAQAFVYAFFAVWTSLVFVLNYTVWISWIYAYIIPMWLLFHLTTARKRTARTMRLEK